MKRPNIVPNTRPALEAGEYAKERFKFDQFHLAVFKTYWEEGKNIGLRSVLHDIAKECGLDGDELVSCLVEGRYAARIDNQNEEARASGITGIPAYIIGDHLIEGAQPYQIFQRAVELMQRRGKKPQR